MQTCRKNSGAPETCGKLFGSRTGIDELRTSEYESTRFVICNGVRKARSLVFHVHHSFCSAHAAATAPALQVMWRDTVEHDADIVPIELPCNSIETEVT
jgi:hypothetical protein